MFMKLLIVYIPIKCTIFRVRPNLGLPLNCAGRPFWGERLALEFLLHMIFRSLHVREELLNNVNAVCDVALRQICNFVGCFSRVLYQFSNLCKNFRKIEIWLNS